MMRWSRPRAPRDWFGLAELAPPPTSPPPPPPKRALAPTAVPLSSAITCSTGPPGAAWITAKLITMIANSVGMISSSRRTIYASIFGYGDAAARSAAVTARARPCASRERLAHGDDGHVEVEIAQALGVLRVIDTADAGSDADPLQVLDERLRDPGEGAVGRQQDLELEGLAGLLIDEAAVLDRPARLLQQVERLAEVVADIAAAVALRGLIDLGENLGRDLALIALEDFEVVAFGQPRGRQL